MFTSHTSHSLLSCLRHLINVKQNKNQKNSLQLLLSNSQVYEKIRNEKKRQRMNRGKKYKVKRIVN
jgi:hypothetical protein